MIPLVELQTQFRSIEHEIRAAIDEVFARSWFIMGEQVKAFEEEFASYIGTKHAVGVGSGTEAVHLALVAAGVRPGDDVITAANTCVPTPAAISFAGAKPVLVDIEPATSTVDPAKLSEAITDRTKAIVPVHMYGHPCDMDPILEIANDYKLVVVEDCAHAHGSKYRGKRCGSFGTAAAFSFYPSKNLGAYGDGGAVLTNDDGIAAEIRMLRNYGEERRYYHPIKGYNSRLDELQAAVLRVKLRHLETWNTARRERAAAYRRHLAGLSVVPPSEAPWAKHVYYLFVVRSTHRDALQVHLEQNQIKTLIHYPIPVHLQEAYADLGLPAGTFPETEKVADEVLSLPMYPELPLDSITRVAQAIADFQP